jgi:succinate-semialdehyde dehydrogenase/glutarate-semialdehyde dehydrogenase
MTRGQSAAMPFASLNPATGELLKSFATTSADEVEASLARAGAALANWRALPLSRRATIVGKAAGLLERDRERLGQLASLEMGKPLAAGIGEVDKSAVGCRYFAENADHMLADEDITEPNGARERIRYEALGVVLSIMPWNFPYWQTLRFAAPALIAGNVVLLKPAPSTPQCGLAVIDIFHEAGIPAGVFQALLIEPDTIARVIADPRVAAVTLTGSERAGKAVAAAAGAALKKSILELGGSDPFVVLPSADLDLAVATAVKARMTNNGQSCIAAKRFIVTAPVYEAFKTRFVAAVAALKLGPGTDPKADIGPLATSAIRDGLANQVERTVAAGAKVLTGGKAPARPGFYYEPTVLEGVPPGSPAAAEELFGPVAALFKVADADEALRLANDTPYGLGASVFTKDADEADRFARGIEAGMVFINEMVISDARFPFGGVKRSGYGRELGTHGVRELVNVKRVRVSGVSGA